MNNLGILFIVFGVILTFFGVIVYFNINFPLPGNLPGDIKIKGDNFSFYFPITSSILFSIVLSLIFYFLNR